MQKTKNDCLMLTEYLIIRGLISEDYRELSIVHCKDQDKENKKHARSFAHVMSEEWSIHCTKALENLPQEARVGLLLHEIGHIHQNAFYGKGKEDLEIAVDEWIMVKIPEAQYSYKDCQFNDPYTNKLRIARNVQCVASEFVRSIYSVE